MSLPVSAEVNMSSRRARTSQGSGLRRRLTWSWSGRSRRKAVLRAVFRIRAAVRAQPGAFLLTLVATALLFAAAIRVYPRRLSRHHSARRSSAPHSELEEDAQVADANNGPDDVDNLSIAGSAADFGGIAARLAREPPVDPAGEARIAYFVQVGPDSVAMLPRLFSRLHHPDNVYVVHMDTKIASNERETVRALIASSHAYRRNVHILRGEMVTYKGISMVMNTIAGMTLARRVDPHWDYFINISGADYPLVGAIAQRRLLARPGVAAGYLNYMSLFPQREWSTYSFRAKSQYWDPAIVGFQHPHSRLRRMRRHRYNPLEPYRRYSFVKAEAWAILSGSFCDFIIRSAFAKTMLLNHLHMLSAPEHYFADVLFNHPVWRKTLVPDAFRKVVWYHKHHRAGQHPYVLDSSKSEPFEFWVYLRGTRSLFARKFTVPNSPILDRIDSELSGSHLQTTNSSHSMEDYRQRSREFHSSLVHHFDELTKMTLRTQGVRWPDRSYADLRS